MQGARLEQSVRLLVLSVGITAFGGMLLGGAGFLAASLDPAEGWRQVRWLPLSMFFSMPFTLPFGLVCGVLATGVLELLLRTRFRTASRGKWIVLGGAAGLALGALCPLFLRVLGFDMDDPKALALFGGFGGAVGAGCGLMLGWLGWAESRRRP